MTEPFILLTERPGVELRELATEADDAAYRAAIEANSEFSDPDADRLRFGIWDGEVLAGSISLTADQYGSAEIDYRLDTRYVGHGYAALAAKALARYGRDKYSLVYANVANDDQADITELERAGFQWLSKELGRTVLGLSQRDAPPAAKAARGYKKGEPVSTDQELEKFADLPSRRDSLRAKDKNNLTVFLSFGVAKKLYRCPCCSGVIDIGSGHAIMSRVQMSKQYSHHHIDLDCMHNKILPTLNSIQVIKSDEASASAVNARSRRYRNRKRRR